MNYHCILPSGNASEFPTIRRALRKRGVRFTDRKKWLGREFIIPGDQLKKMPHWKSHPFLPVDMAATHGHSIWPMMK